MKRIFIAVFVLVGIAAIATYFYYSNALAPTEVPVKVVAAEEAIATSNTIAIASVDMAYVRRINDMLTGKKDPSPLRNPKPAQSLFADFKAQGVNLFSETDYALAAINVTQGKPAYTFVLFGHFSLDKFKQAIHQLYKVNESPGEYWIIEKLPEHKKSDDPCAVQNSAGKQPVPVRHALYIQNDRILLSSPELMPVLLKRFAENASAVVSLAKWRVFRKDKVVAGAVISPKDAKKGAVDLPSALLLGAVSNQPLEDIYAGAKVNLLPTPGLIMLVDAHASKAAWPGEFKSKYDTWLSETVGDLQDMPTLATLIQSLHVQAKGNILHLKTRVDRTTMANLEKVPAEFFRMIFSQASIGSGKPEAVGAEQIVQASDVEKYQSHFDFSSIQPFNGKKAFYQPDVIVGPFGVRLERFGLLATDNSIIELKIKAEGSGFENLSVDTMHQSEASPAASLSIISVEDAAGNNLLREEQCGKTRNLAAGTLTTLRDKEYVNKHWVAKSIKIYGDKTVRLKQGVPVSDVAKIKGKIAVRAAMRTKVVTLQPPLKGKTIENAKVRMYLKGVKGHTIKYELSGHPSYILAVRSKNEKGQYLASAGSSSAGFGDIKTVAKNFKGKIDSLEVVVAEKMKSKEYPFVIEHIAPRYGKPGNGKQPGVTSSSKQAFLKKYAQVEHKGVCKNKQQQELGAFLVCMNGFGKHWGGKTGGEFDVYAPAADALRDNLAAGELSIDTVTTETGEELSFQQNEKLDFNYRFDNRYNNVRKHWENVNQRLQATNVRIFSDKEELKGKKLKLVKGTLTIRIPKQAQYFQLAANELGVERKSKNGIRANISAYEDWSTYIDVQGPADKIIRFMPLAKDGTILSTGNDRIKLKTYPTWGLSKEDKQKIESLPKKWEGKITIYGVPELIRIYYSDDFAVIKHNFQFSVN